MTYSPTVPFGDGGVGPLLVVLRRPRRLPVRRALVVQALCVVTTITGCRLVVRFVSYDTIHNGNTTVSRQEASCRDSRPHRSGAGAPLGARVQGGLT